MKRPPGYWEAYLVILSLCSGIAALAASAVENSTPGSLISGAMVGVCAGRIAAWISGRH